MIEQLVSYDRSLLLLLNGSDSQIVDGVFWIATHTATWLFFFASLLYVIVKNNDFRRTAFLLLGICLLVAATDIFSSGVCKPYFHRLRPSHNPDILNDVKLVCGYAGGTYGFISSHAANTFGLATFLALEFRSTGVSCVLFLWACLSSYSRIYLGVHYPSDIFFGLVAGVFFAFLVYFISDKVLKRRDTVQQSMSESFTQSGYLCKDLQLPGIALSATFTVVVVCAVFFATH